MADRVYTKEDLQKYLKAQEDALNETDNSNNFENIHSLAIEDLRAFINGKIDITTDSFETMLSFIETFAGGYKSDEMKKLYTDAMAKLVQKQEKQKNKILEEVLEETKQEEQAKEETEQEEKKKEEEKKDKEEKDLDAIARRIRILLVPDKNNKEARIDSIQKELSALSGKELSTVSEKLQAQKAQPFNLKKANLLQKKAATQENNNQGRLL